MGSAALAQGLCLQLSVPRAWHSNRQPVPNQCWCRGRGGLTYSLLFSGVGEGGRGDFGLETSCWKPVGTNLRDLQSCRWGENTTDTLQVFCARPALHYMSERNSRRRSDWTHALTPCSQSCQLTFSVWNCPGEAGPGAWASESHQGDRQTREMDQEDASWRTGWGVLQVKADGRGQSSVCGRVSGRQRAVCP